MGLFSKKKQDKQQIVAQKKQHIWIQFNADLLDLERQQKELDTITANLQELREAIDNAQKSIDDSTPESVIILIKLNIKIINQNEEYRSKLVRSCKDLQNKTNVLFLKQKLCELDDK